MISIIFILIRAFSDPPLVLYCHFPQTLMFFATNKAIKLTVVQIFGLV